MPTASEDFETLLAPLSAAGLAVCVLDDAQRVRAATPLFAQRLACDAASVIGESLEHLLGAVARQAAVGACEVYRGGARDEALFLRPRRFALGEATCVELMDVSSEWRLLDKLGAELEARDRLMRDADVGIFRYDPDTETFTGSAVVQRRQTVDGGEAKIHPDDLVRLTELRERIADAGGAESFTLRRERSDGAWSYTQLHVSAGRKMRSGRYEIFGLGQDISELVQARDEASAVSRRLEIALQCARAGVYEADLLTGKRWASPQYVEICGQEAMERTPTNPLGMYMDEDIPAVAKAWQETLTTNSVVSMDARLYRPEGDGPWVRMFSRAQRNRKGEAVRVIGLMLDIDAHKRQELALIEAKSEAATIRERLDIALRCAQAGAYECNLRTGENWVSPEFARLCGRQALERGKTSLVGLYHLDDAPLVKAKWLETLNSTEVIAVDARLWRPEGDGPWVRLFSRAQRNEAGEVERVIGLMLDIDAAKRQELALIEAKRAAEAAAVAKSNFLASMSHEIRTPLNGVLGMAQSLAHDALGAAEMEKVNIILESGRTLMALLNDVLDISKIEAGRMEISRVETDLATMVDRLRQLFLPRATEVGLSINIEMEDGLPARIACDPVRVRQCITNLMSNAVKFTERGGVTVRVGGRKLPDGEWCMLVGVTDTGIGIDADTQTRLFASFTQADASISRRFGGSGLGLSITRQLARLMGGDVDVVSEPGQGSTFTLSFRAAAIVEEKAETLGETSVGDAELARITGAKVLLVDDNAVNRQVVKLFLKPHNVRFVEAANGQEALNKLYAERFDIMLLDIHMPVMDGRECIGRVRASGEPWAQMPVIALTADAMSGDRERFLGMGMNDYASKPIDQRELITKLARALAGRDLLKDDPDAVFEMKRAS